MIDNISIVYAKALYQISEENKEVDLVRDFTGFTELVNSSNNLENLLFYESFSAEEKISVLTKIFEKTNYSEFFKSFLALLVENKRVTYYPQIFKELTVLDDDSRGFLRGTIESSEKISEETITKVKKYLEERVGKKIVLEYKTNKSITAGVRTTVGDLLLDATLEHQFDLLKSV